VRNELGIRGISFRKIGAFNYFAPQGKKCENEHCALIVGRYAGKVKANPRVAYGFRWLSFGETVAEIRKKPQSYVMWARLGARLLRKHTLGRHLLRSKSKNTA
jgi:isopentenyldiphosphate isomerase